MPVQNKQPSSTELSPKGSGTSAFLSIIAVLLSALSLGGTIFVLTQLFELQKTFSDLDASVDRSPHTSESPQITNSPTVSVAESNQQANTETKSSQLTQYAFKDRALVELLDVKRIQNPESNARDIVNVKMRFRRLKPVRKVEVIVLEQTKARNPETSETYESYNRVLKDAERERAKVENRKTDYSKIDHSSGVIQMGLIEQQGASVDGYVWMSIPENVTTVDLIVPDTATFEKVPISDRS
jgi:hypothetical protein